MLTDGQVDPQGRWSEKGVEWDPADTQIFVTKTMLSQSGGQFDFFF